MIRVHDVSHTYPSSKAPAVANVGFEVEQGHIFGLLGPSGAGKSTIQGLMTGLLNLQSGSITYDGKPLREWGRKFFQKVGVSFELPNLYPKLTGAEHLKYWAGLYEVPCESPEYLLDLVDLTKAARVRAEGYSKGMKQRLTFARALVNKPKTLFLDEPTSGLDPNTAARIKEIIKDLKAKGCTIILTTHNMALADELSDTVAFIESGKIAAIDTPAALKLRFGERSVRILRTPEVEPRELSLFLDDTGDRMALKGLIDEGAIVTMHTQEASLEDIFIRITGRGLA